MLDTPLHLGLSVCRYHLLFCTTCRRRNVKNSVTWSKPVPLVLLDSYQVSSLTSGLLLTSTTRASFFSASYTRVLYE